MTLTAGRGILLGTVIGVAGLGAGWYLFRPERLFLDRRVAEAPPDLTGDVLLVGTFEPRAHKGQGTARVLAVGARRVLRLDDFETLDGPDLHVYLVVDAAVETAAALERTGFIPLGPLKGNVGAQNYEIPQGAELDDYGGVMIWCERFGVNFTSAVFRR